MKILNSLVRFAFSFRAKKIHYFMQHPHEVQEQWLQHLISRAKNTQWGQEFGFQSIKTHKDFQKQLPLSDYETLKPYIRQMMLGQKDVLWPGQTKWFSKSSGTTNDKSKYLPVSMENLKTCHLQGSHDALALWYHSQPQTQVMSNAKSLIMGGSLERFAEFPESQIGDISAIMLLNMPFYGKYFYTPSMETALMKDWEQKIELMAHEICRENLTTIGGVPTWTIVLFRKLLEVTGKSNILEIFPNFEVYMHGGVSFEPYRQQFKAFLPSEKVQYRENYNASEGYFASQYDGQNKDMLLLLDNGVYYEFMPLSELGSAQPIVLSLAEVELDQDYALLISSNAGLWRYQIGDTIRFTSLAPYRIQISGRTKHFINVFGEEVMVQNTDKALAICCEKWGARISEYTVGPIFLEEGKGGHEWWIEFEQQPKNLAAFAQDLDQTLQSLNSDYEAKRYRNLALQPLKLHTLAKGSFHAWLKSRGKYGGQNKVPRLSNSREYIEALAQFEQ